MNLAENPAGGKGGGGGSRGQTRGRNAMSARHPGRCDVTLWGTLGMNSAPTNPEHHSGRYHNQREWEMDLPACECVCERV